MNLEELKKCRKCKEEKPLAEFSKNKAFACGLDSMCKKCASALGRAYRVQKGQHPASTHADSSKTHGMSKTSIYSIWSGIIQRCCDPESTSYENYGARGITVCDQWRNSFEAFIADMVDRPKGSHIDRINNDMGYEPGNCRWVSVRESINNRRNTVFITHNGLTKPITVWAEETGIKAHTLRYRILKAKWPVQKALSTSAFRDLEQS